MSSIHSNLIISIMVNMINIILPMSIFPTVVCPLLYIFTRICVEECSSDDDCSGGELCCSNGCAHFCLPGVPA